MAGTTWLPFFLTTASDLGSCFYYLTMANHALTMKPLPTMVGSGLSSLYHVYPTQPWLTLLFDQGHNTENDKMADSRLWLVTMVYQQFIQRSWLAILMPGATMILVINHNHG